MLVDFFMQQPPPFPGEPITRNDAEALAFFCCPISVTMPTGTMSKEDDEILARFSREHRRD
jgi:hypothetical protein